DSLVALWLTLPLTFWLLLAPARWFSARWHRALFWTACALLWAVQSFLLFAEYFFFEEFKSRFNTVAVDYVLYPQEVFINIWQSYHVGIVLAVCAALGVVWIFTAKRLFAGFWPGPSSIPPRWLRLAAGAALAGTLVPFLLVAGALTGVMTPHLRLKGAHVGVN